MARPPDGGDAGGKAATAEMVLAAVWMDRDSGWLEFNRRVLAEAEDARTPPLERVKFLAIFSSNLDEFFMKRVALIRERLTSDREQRIREIRERLVPMLQAQAACFDSLLPSLASHGVRLLAWKDLDEAQRSELSRYFDTQVSPALTPLFIKPGDPFPFFSNLSLSISFCLEQDENLDEAAYARVKVPADLPQWIPVTANVAAGEQVLVRLHEVIRENASKLYRGMRLTAPTLFRLTRDAEVELDDELDRDLRELVKEQIRQRRFEPAVRLEFAAGADPHIREMLRARFQLLPQDVYELPGEVDYTGLFRIAGLDRPELRDLPWTPRTPSRMADTTSLFEVIRAGDLLVHHPYESFDDTVEEFIKAAASDSRTIAIKMTVYRVGDDTPFVRSLMAAAQAGKQVACVIELKARFDEERNLHWAAELERVGAHVTVGNAALKTHAKVALVVRLENEGLRCYVHIGTGHYHVRTARLYTDVGLFTCDPVIAADVVQLFHYLTGRSATPDYQRLLVAPEAMRQRFLDLVADEIEHHRAGRPARIVAKMNQLEDPSMIMALCEASGAGVPIDLIVRGFCCLKPGIAGFSDTIRIRSIIGRFLEHSRIFHFAAGAAEPLEGEFYIGSGDWMSRNLSRRVEVATPVLDRTARERLWEILRISLDDVRQGWVMQSDGSYVRAAGDAAASPEAALGTHAWLMARARTLAGDA